MTRVDQLGCFLARLFLHRGSKRPSRSELRINRGSGLPGGAGGKRAGHRHPHPINYTLLFSIPGAFLISGTVASRESLPRLVLAGEALLLVLVPLEQQTLVGPASEVGGRSCLILPIHPEEVTCTLAPRGQATKRAGTRWISTRPRRRTRGKQSAARLNSPFGLGKT